MTDRVHSNDLGKLIPYAISIAYWLKDNSPQEAADVLADAPSKQIKENVNACIKQCVSSIDGAEFELTNAQVRYIFSQYDNDTWAHALKRIICESTNPSLIDDKIKKDLVDWAFHFINDGGSDWNELFEETGNSMSRLGYINFQVLGEFCSLIRDCSRKFGFDVISQSIGWEVLKPRNMTGEVPLKRKQAAGRLFEQMVSKADRIFGQSGSPIGSVSFAIRSKAEVTQWTMVPFLPADKKAMQDLRTFYSFIDKKFVGIVEDLFEYHEFVDIAEAINHKYNMIPAPWKSTLSKMKLEKKHPLKWFDYNKIKTPAPGIQKQKQKKNQSMPLLPNKQTQADVIVDSFIDSEVVYYRRIGAMGNFYVSRLQKILANPNSMEAKLLNLTSQDVDFLFGFRFQKILDLTHQLLTNLELVNLTRKHLKPPHTREQVLAKIISKFAPEDLYNAYSQYSATYPPCSEMLKRKLQAKQLLQQKGVKYDGVDFIDLWYKIRSSLPSMETKELEEVMELPVQRIHKYRDYLKQLISITKKDTQVYADLYDASLAVRRAADQLTKVSEKNALSLTTSQRHL